MQDFNDPLPYRLPSGSIANLTARRGVDIKSCNQIAILNYHFSKFIDIKSCNQIAIVIYGQLHIIFSLALIKNVD